MKKILPVTRFKTLARNDWYIAVFLFAGTAASRLPFRVSYLFSWDSVLYTRAIQHFDVRVHQPQPPGYIFYVGLVWLVNHFLGDPNAAMIWISVFASAAAVAAFYWLGRIMFGRQAGLVASILLATSLNFWGLSEVAFPYVLLTLFSTLVAILLFKAWRGQAGYILAAAAVLGLASGFRQDLLTFMLPLFLLVLWSKGWRRTLEALALLAFCTASWYVPSSLLTGGFAVYRHASSAETAGVFRDFSIFGKGAHALLTNARQFEHFMLLALGGAAPFLIYFILRLVAPGAGRFRRDRRLLFLAVWFLPPAVFYMLVHIGESGYVMSIIAPALLAASWGFSHLAADAGRLLGSHRLSRFRNARMQSGVRHLIYILPALAVAANLFLFLGTYKGLSSRKLARSDEVLQSRLRTVRADFDPRTTLIVAVYRFEQVSYYLPDYQVWHFDPVENKDPRTSIPPGIKDVVFFGSEFELKHVSLAEALPLKGGANLVYIDTRRVQPGQHQLAVDWNRMKVSLS